MHEFKEKQTVFGDFFVHAAADTEIMTVKQGHAFDVFWFCIESHGGLCRGEEETQDSLEEEYQAALRALVEHATKRVSCDYLRPLLFLFSIGRSGSSWVATDSCSGAAVFYTRHFTDSAGRFCSSRDAGSRQCCRRCAHGRR
jgi:hypothetical protein